MSANDECSRWIGRDWTLHSRNEICFLLSRLRSSLSEPNPQDFTSRQIIPFRPEFRVSNYCNLIYSDFLGEQNWGLLIWSGVREGVGAGKGVETWYRQKRKEQLLQTTFNCKTNFLLGVEILPPSISHVKITTCKEILPQSKSDDTDIIIMYGNNL